MLNRYYYYRLSPRARRAYDEIYNGLLSMSTPVIDARWFDKSEFRRINQSLELDNPQLFYVNWHAPIGCRKYQHTAEFDFRYLYNRHEVEEIRGEMDALARSLSGIAERSKTLAVHDWFIDNVRYDHDGIAALIGSPSMFNAVGAIRDKKAVCQGISQLACYLLRQKGVSATVILGPYKNGVIHAWNGVWVDGAMRHMDVTFDMAASEYGGRSRDYFLLEQDEILRDRSIIAI